jgi:hypothetical protein
LNLLALLFTGLTVVSCLCMSAIFAFPQAPFNPFPPDDDLLLTPEIQATATGINLPTDPVLPTLGRLPSEQTATPANGQPSASPTAPGTATSGPSPAAATPTNTPAPPIDIPTATATLGGYPGDATATPSSTATSGTPYP